MRAWVKLTTGETAGIEAEDIIAVGSEFNDESTVVFASDGLGRRLASSSVDGVIDPEKSVGVAETELLQPLVDHVIDEPALKTAALLCYGDDCAGRGESLFGRDALLHATAERCLQHRSPPGGSSTLHVGAALISMELLIDLYSAYLQRAYR